MTRTIQGRAYVKDGEDKLTYYTPRNTGYRHTWRYRKPFKRVGRNPHHKPINYTKKDKEAVSVDG